MNQKRKPLTDAMFEPESSEALARRDEIERRLKATRPQPPRLDIATLRRIADHATTDAVVERPAERQSPRAGSRRNRRIVGRMLVIVGAWICGAVVGALAMFVLIDRAALETDLSSDVIQIETETPGSIAKLPAERESDVIDDAASVEGTEGRNAKMTMLTTVLDPLARADSTYLTDGPTLDAGMYLRRYSRQSSMALEWTGEEKRRFSMDSERSHLEPPTARPPVTPRNLMQEFL